LFYVTKYEHRGSEAREGGFKTYIIVEAASIIITVTVNLI